MAAHRAAGDLLSLSVVFNAIPKSLHIIQYSLFVIVYMQAFLFVRFSSTIGNELITGLRNYVTHLSVGVLLCQPALFLSLPLSLCVLELVLIFLRTVLFVSSRVCVQFSESLSLSLSISLRCSASACACACVSSASLRLHTASVALHSTLPYIPPNMASAFPSVCRRVRACIVRVFPVKNHCCC